jgi:outer membrane protein assembly factor BamB
VVAVASLLALLTGSIDAASATTPPPVRDWPTVGFNVQRTGSNPFESVLSSATVQAGLKQAWSSYVGAEIDTPPIVATGVTTSQGKVNLVFAGSEHGLFRAVNASTGATVWQRQLGWHLGGPTEPNCTNSEYGITDAATFNRATNTVYVVDGNNELYALNMSTGVTQMGWPIPLSTHTFAPFEHIWSGLTLLGGTLYVEVASDCDDGQYEGRVDAISTTTHTITATFNVEAPNSGVYGGGIWGWGGVSAIGSQLYTATGNALGANSNAGYGDQVVELARGSLQLLGDGPPVIAQGDNDFSGTPVLFQPTGCPSDLVAVENKVGSLLIYKLGTLGAGAVQSISLSHKNGTLVGEPAWDATTQMLYVTDTGGAGVYVNGLVALRASSSCHVAFAWDKADPTNPSSVYSVDSPPTVADGVVYYGDGAGNTVYALAASNGSVLWSANLGGSVYAPITVVNGEVLVPTWGHGLVELTAIR